MFGARFLNVSLLKVLVRNVLFLNLELGVSVISAVKFQAVFVTVAFDF